MMSFCVLCFIGFYPVTAPAALSFQASNFHGQYEWNGEKGTRKDVDATFTATGENSWGIKIWFTLDKKTYTYEGFLKGQMGEKLAGEVQNENKSGTYRLAMDYVKDHYEGMHFYLNEDGEEETGLIWLYPNAK